MVRMIEIDYLMQYQANRTKAIYIELNVCKNILIHNVTHYDMWLFYEL